MLSDWQRTVTTKSGKQVIVRYPRLSDAKALMEYINPFVDEDEFLMINQHKTLADEQAYLDDIQKKMQAAEAVYLFAGYDGKIIGTCDVRQDEAKSDHVGMLGISIAKDFRGDGLGKILMEEITVQAKDHLGVQVIRLTCFVNNQRALRLYEKLGFQEYGRLPKGIRYKGTPTDRVYMYKEV